MNMKLTGPASASSGSSGSELKTGPPGPPLLGLADCDSEKAGHADFTSPMYCSFASFDGKFPSCFHAALQITKTNVKGTWQKLWQSSLCLMSSKNSVL